MGKQDAPCLEPLAGSSLPGAGRPGDAEAVHRPPRGGEAVAGGMELVSLPFPGFPGKSLGKRWAVRRPGRGVDEISQSLL